MITMVKNYDLSVILPVYNEVNVINKVISEIYEKIVFNFRGKVEVVVAEDGSTDGTKELLLELNKKYPFKLVIGSERKGYNKAVKDSLSLATGNFVFMADSGGSHEMNDFYRMFKHTSDYSIISGYKKKRNDPLHRIVLSRVYNFYVSMLFKHHFFDIDCGFKIYRKEVLDRMLPQVKTFKECISTEIMLRSFVFGYKIKEISIIHYSRKRKGPAKTFSLKKIPKLVTTLFMDTIKLRKELSKKN
jgi:glycosyltransferase involved in cell wall biosynthesis